VILIWNSRDLGASRECSRGSWPSHKCKREIEDEIRARFKLFLADFQGLASSKQLINYLDMPLND